MTVDRWVRKPVEDEVGRALPCHVYRRELRRGQRERVRRPEELLGLMLPHALLVERDAQPLAPLAEHAKRGDPAREPLWPTPHLLVRNPIPERKVVGVIRVVVRGDEAGEDRTEEVVPRDRLEAVLFEPLDPGEDALPVLLLALERHLGNPAAEVEPVPEVVFHHPHHHDREGCPVYRGRCREFGHNPLAQGRVGDISFHQQRHLVHHGRSVHSVPTRRPRFDYQFPFAFVCDKDLAHRLGMPIDE